MYRSTKNRVSKVYGGQTVNMVLDVHYSSSIAFQVYTPNDNSIQTVVLLILGVA